MLLSFQMLPAQPAQELLDAAVLADRLGYHACYSVDEIYHKDARSTHRADPARPLRRGELSGLRAVVPLYRFVYSMDPFHSEDLA
jgi:hypothetical protein